MRSKNNWLRYVLFLTIIGGITAGSFFLLQEIKPPTRLVVKTVER